MQVKNATSANLMHQFLFPYKKILYSVRKAFAKRLAIPLPIGRLPFSISEIRVGPAPIISASCFCVNPSRERRPRNALPVWKSVKTFSMEYPLSPSLLFLRRAGHLLQDILHVFQLLSILGPLPLAKEIPGLVIVFEGKGAQGGLVELFKKRRQG